MVLVTVLLECNDLDLPTINLTRFCIINQVKNIIAKHLETNHRNAHGIVWIVLVHLIVLREER